MAVIFASIEYQTNSAHICFGHNKMLVLGSFSYFKYAFINVKLCKFKNLSMLTLLSHICTTFKLQVDRNHYISFHSVIRAVIYFIKQQFLT